MFKPEPLPHDAVVKAGEYCLEQDNNLVSGANPRGIGDYFGSATQDNLNSKKTSVLWCDNELQPVSTTNVCRCIEPGKAYATKDPETARHMRVTAVEYTKEGVEVWVEYEKKTKKNQKKLKKTPVTTTTPTKRKRNVVATRTAKAKPKPKQKATSKAKAKPSTTSPKKKATAKADARWLRCRKKSLTTDQGTKLNDCFDKATNDMTWLPDGFSLQMYYAVVDRLARE